MNLDFIGLEDGISISWSASDEAGIGHWSSTDRWDNSQTDEE